MSETLKPCAECGMPVEPGEYHPYAACLMFKQTHNSATVRANLWSVQDDISNHWRSVAEQAEMALKTIRSHAGEIRLLNWNTRSAPIADGIACEIIDEVNPALAAFDSLRKEES